MFDTHGWASVGVDEISLLQQHIRVLEGTANALCQTVAAAADESRVCSNSSRKEGLAVREVSVTSPGSLNSEVGTHVSRTRSAGASFSQQLRGGQCLARDPASQTNVVLEPVEKSPVNPVQLWSLYTRLPRPLTVPVEPVCSDPVLIPTDKRPHRSKPSWKLALLRSNKVREYETVQAWKELTEGCRYGIAHKLSSVSDEAPYEPVSPEHNIVPSAYLQSTHGSKGLCESDFGKRPSPEKSICSSGFVSPFPSSDLALDC